MKYTAKECRCWCKYPNTSYKRFNGSWKCVDCYELVSDVVDVVGLRRKTICKLKEDKENG